MKSLEKAYAEVTKLEPLEDDSDDRNNIARLHRMAGLMYMHLTGVMYASGIEPDTDCWREIEVPTDGKMIPQTRFNSLLAQDMVPVTAQDWAYDLGVCLGQKAREEGALLRLYRGYTTDGNLRDYIGTYAYNGTFISICEASFSIEQITNVCDRLYRREMLQADIKTDDKLQSYVHGLLGIIQAIRYAREWGTLDRATKGRYREAVIADLVAGEEELERKKISVVLGHRHEKIVKARKDLAKLYEQFGVCILLDAFWNPSICYADGKTGRSITFTSMVAIALKTPPREMPHKSMEFFVELMDIIGGPVRDYVFDFVDNRTSAGQTV
ncbi:hypothetical protein JR316_0013130 [Psilocybe cubensis]|uniref:Uncharacterized protein n=2 Tax=Psilocybe cubensis TaxID=181762 RepID=A0A8H7XS08_PSICU|nr:hypothetical protein JR316_0013130 [Psilocybe cubensis]KAH9474666.1 hypothetical protein JR316_0013130 [Psilocybe cubensis]